MQQGFFFPPLFFPGEEERSEMHLITSPPPFPKRGTEVRGRKRRKACGMARALDIQDDVNAYFPSDGQEECVLPKFPFRKNSQEKNRFRSDFQARKEEKEEGREGPSPSLDSIFHF